MNDHDLDSQLLAAARAGDLEAVLGLAVRTADDVDGSVVQDPRNCKEVVASQGV
jgi:hypothetical protein